MWFFYWLKLQDFRITYHWCYDFFLKSCIFCYRNQQSTWYYHNGLDLELFHQDFSSGEGDKPCCNAVFQCQNYKFLSLKLQSLFLAFRGQNLSLWYMSLEVENLYFNAKLEHLYYNKLTWSLSHGFLTLKSVTNSKATCSFF